MFWLVVAVKIIGIITAIISLWFNCSNGLNRLEVAYLHLVFTAIHINR